MDLVNVSVWGFRLTANYIKLFNQSFIVDNAKVCMRVSEEKRMKKVTNGVVTHLNDLMDDVINVSLVSDTFPWARVQAEFNNYIMGEVVA